MSSCCRNIPILDTHDTHGPISLSLTTFDIPHTRRQLQHPLLFLFHLPLPALTMDSDSSALAHDEPAEELAVDLDQPEEDTESDSDSGSYMVSPCPLRS